MIDWTHEAIEAAHCAMFQEPYDGTTAVMIGAGLDAAAAAQGMETENALREENARLREALEPFAKAADCCEDKSHIDYASVRIDHLRAARAAIL